MRPLPAAIVTACLALAGCGGASGEDKGGSSSAAPPETTVTTAPSTTATEAPPATAADLCADAELKAAIEDLLGATTTCTHNELSGGSLNVWAAGDDETNRAGVNVYDFASGGADRNRYGTASAPAGNELTLNGIKCKDGLTVLACFPDDDTAIWLTVPSAKAGDNAGKKAFAEAALSSASAGG